MDGGQSTVAAPFYSQKRSIANLFGGCGLPTAAGVSIRLPRSRRRSATWSPALYLQAWSTAPGANPAGVVVSNGVDWRRGSI